VRRQLKRNLVPKKGAALPNVSAFTEGEIGTMAVIAMGYRGGGAADGTVRLSG
jgi:hypothetical protein